MNVMNPTAAMHSRLESLVDNGSRVMPRVAAHDNIICVARLLSVPHCDLGDWVDCVFRSSPIYELIYTLLITVLVESLVVVGYCRRYQKPVISILLTSAVANLITQALLWTVVNVFFQDYLVVLGVTEFAIWIVESFSLYAVRTNQLTFLESTSLSFAMNVTSVAVGWWLPI